MKTCWDKKNKRRPTFFDKTEMIPLLHNISQDVVFNRDAKQSYNPAGNQKKIMYYHNINFALFSQRPEGGSHKTEGVQLPNPQQYYSFYPIQHEKESGYQKETSVIYSWQKTIMTTRDMCIFIAYV